MGKFKTGQRDFISVQGKKNKILIQAEYSKENYCKPFQFNVLIFET